MPWYYKSVGLEKGPVSDTEIEELFQTGKIGHDTSVRRAATAEWQPLSMARPEIWSRTIANSTQMACGECGRIFPADDLVNLNYSWVCAQCKPVFLQRMAEGVSTAAAAGVWRQGKKLITRSETPFPDRCVKCNGSASGYRLKRTLYWQHPAYYLLLLCNLIILLIVVMIVRKKAVLYIGLCEMHRAQRRIAIIACSVGMIGGLALIIWAAINASGWLAFTGTLCFLTGAVWGVWKGRTIAASKIDKYLVTVSGVCRDFLKDLPERP